MKTYNNKDNGIGQSDFFSLTVSSSCFKELKHLKRQTIKLHCAYNKYNIIAHYCGC